jgi:hypothetical protein
VSNKKIVARVEDGTHYLYFKDEYGTLIDLTNTTQAIIKIPDNETARRLSQAFPSLDFKVGISIALVSLEG